MYSYKGDWRNGNVPALQAGVESSILSLPTVTTVGHLLTQTLKGVCMAYREETPLTSSSKSGSGVSANQTGFGDHTKFSVLVNVTDAEPTTYVTVWLEDSTDGTNFFVVDALQVQGEGKHALRVDSGTADTLRIRFNVSEGSATFSVALAATSLAPLEV